jgi:hypothetical protein
VGANDFEMGFAMQDQANYEVVFDLIKAEFFILHSALRGKKFTSKTMGETK